MQSDLQFKTSLVDALSAEVLAMAPDFWQTMLSELEMNSSGDMYSKLVVDRQQQSLPTLISKDGKRVPATKATNLDDQSSAPAGSIAHLKLSGPMLSHDMLWFRGINHLTAALMSADSNPHISGVLLEVNSGGGQVIAGEMLMSTLAGMRKPVVVFTHYMASAAIMGTLPVNAIVASSPGVRVGSIGTYIELNKYQLQNRKQWYHTIYAKKSTRKNYEFRQAEGGNYKPFEELIEKINNAFIANVTAFRPLAGKQSSTLSGEMFFAEEGLRRGLIDQVGTFNDALTLLRKQITQKSSTKSTSKKQIHTATATVPAYMQNPLYKKMGVADTTDAAPADQTPTYLQNPLYKKVGVADTARLAPSRLAAESDQDSNSSADEAWRAWTESGSPRK